MADMAVCKAQEPQEWDFSFCIPSPFHPFRYQFDGYSIWQRYITRTKVSQISRHLQRPSCWTACSLGFALWYRHVQQNDERWGPWNHVALVFAHPSSQPRARHPSRWTLPVDKLSGAPRWNESRVTNATKSLTMSWCCKSKPFLNVLSAHDSTLLKQLNLSATATFGTFWDNLWFFYEASKKACVRSFSGDLVASLRQI